MTERKRDLTDDYTQRQLANEYNVSQKTISNIVNYKFWKYI